MSFKDRKRDDHGHVIGNDEVDGQKCQHGAGGSKSQNNSERENLRKEVEYKLKTEGNTSDVRLMAERRGFKIENGKVVEDLKSQAMADRATGGSGEAFDDDYEEEFNEPDEARGPYNEVDFNWVKDHIEDNPDINEKELVEHVKEKFGDINPEDEQKIKELINKKEPYKPQFEPEDFGDARFYPTKSNMDGNRWVGRYRGIGEALGLKDWNDERVKYVGDHNGTSIVQLPDGYYSINPNITSMSFKTKKALEDYLDRKNPEEHKYGVYWDGDIQRTYRGKDDNGKEYDMEGPDAYKAARKNKPTGTQSNQEKISRVKNLVDKGILSKEDWTRFMNGSLSDEELIKKILG